jgi:hypothetical protein
LVGTSSALSFGTVTQLSEHRSREAWASGAWKLEEEQGPEKRVFDFDLKTCFFNLTD